MRRIAESTGEPDRRMRHVPIPIGTRFGRAVVTGGPEKVRATGYTRNVYTFDCDCGSKGSTDGSALRRGKATSCGCACHDAVLKRAAERRLARSAGHPRAFGTTTRNKLMLTGRNGAKLGQEERFWLQVEKSGPVPASCPELGSCYTWIGSRYGNGYGHLRFNGRTHGAHRVAFFLAHGRWPEPCCLHKCDGGTIPCVRAEHLYEGTKLQNSRDAWKRSRIVALRGEDNPRAKLTASDVLQIRRALRENALSAKAIGRMYGVTGNTVLLIGKRVSWAHLPEEG